MWLWFGIGIGIGVLLLAKSAGATTAIGLSRDDVESLARMIIVEHGNGTVEERIGMAWVAINRLQSGRFGSSIHEVVSRENWSGSGTRYLQKLADASNDPRWDETVELCWLIARGEAPNPIGDRLHFLHPSGMASCSQEGARDGSRVCYDGKWLPTWALQDPVVIGITWFS